MTLASHQLHPILCRCPCCCEDARLRALRITLDAPSDTLPASAVSAGELLDTRFARPVLYEIGEDWNDD